MTNVNLAQQTNGGALKLRRVLKGDEEFICSYPGTSQYSQSYAGGISSSACGLASLNFVRHILQLYADLETGELVLERLVARESMEAVMAICAFWSSSAHLDVDDIHKTPLFDASLRLTTIDYGKAERSKFENILRQLDVADSSLSGPRTVVITRPPEIIACARVADVYVLFDSHPRQAHPDGAAFIFNKSLEKAASYLTNLLAVDPHIFSSSSGLQWQAELLGHVSGHFFERSFNDMRMSPDSLHAFMEANCAVLRFKTTESAAQSEVKLLNAENDSLRRELDTLQEQTKRERAERAADQSELNELRQILSRSDGRREKQKTTAPATVNSSEWSVATPKNFNNISPNAHAIRTERLDVSAPKPQQNAQPNIKGKSKATDIDLALHLQLDYHEEDAWLREEFLHLQTTETQEIFDCSICMDNMPIDDVAHVDLCRHKLCRECMRNYVSSKLEERKYPIMCPVCSMQNSPDVVGRVSEATIQQLGISDRLHAILFEIQLGSFSIPLQCKKCNRSAPVDKAEFDAMKILACPFPRCNYLWCKDCQLEIPLGHEGPEHSCDGSNELKSLMAQRGWKHCPGCKTPTEKIEGCNHMTCSSPGCNTSLSVAVNITVLEDLVQCALQWSQNHTCRLDLRKFQPVLSTRSLTNYEPLPLLPGGHEILDFYAGLEPMGLFLHRAYLNGLLRLASLPSDQPLASVTSKRLRRQPRAHRSSIHELAGASSEARCVETTFPVLAAQSWTPPFTTHIAAHREEALSELGDYARSVCVFSDGSGFEGGVGAAAFLRGPHGTHHIRRLYLGTLTEHTVFEAEVAGVILAADILLAVPHPTSATILLDCQAAITALTQKSQPGQHLLELTQDHISRVLRAHPGLRLHIAWVPGHEGIPENEAVDGHAKEAARGLTTLSRTIPRLDNLPRSIAAAKLAQAQAQARRAE